ncbi:MAG: phosphotransferase [Gammaproteobacteria bacterium]|nr:phosphotransferase [Gammaproteobacteria bacterium]
MLDELEKWTGDQCNKLEGVFEKRKRQARIRECHGDCHLGNLVVINGVVTLFDCLEFDQNLRWIDVMNEVAFVYMDLLDRKQAKLARRFLNRYLELSGDYGGLYVLRFYVVYRAMVRAKVHCLRANQSGIGTDKAASLLDQYREYLILAKQHIGESFPAIIITHGFSGSGKTTLTQFYWNLPVLCACVRMWSVSACMVCRR